MSSLSELVLAALQDDDYADFVGLRVLPKDVTDRLRIAALQEQQQLQVAAHSTHLKFSLRDAGDGHDDAELPMVVELESTAIAIGFDGYGQAAAAAGYGRPVLIEFYEGQVRVLIWRDINQEDPTHIITLDDAKEAMRQDGSHDCNTYS